jgi:uncharacterized protein (TIGR00369 family)
MLVRGLVLGSLGPFSPKVTFIIVWLEMKDMSRWLGDGGMPIIKLLGAELNSYGVDTENLGWVEGSWTPTDICCNPHKIVQAGVSSVILDALMNFAINTGLDNKDRTKATLEMKTELFRPAFSDTPYVIKGSTLRLTKQVAFAESAVYDSHGKTISKATGTFLLHRES